MTPTYLLVSTYATSKNEQDEPSETSARRPRRVPVGDDEQMTTSRGGGKRGSQSLAGSAEHVTERVTQIKKLGIGEWKSLGHFLEYRALIDFSTAQVSGPVFSGSDEGDRSR